MSCPICKRNSDKQLKPFCSKRCADVDLAKWLGGGYALPSSDPDDEDALPKALEIRYFAELSNDIEAGGAISQGLIKKFHESMLWNSEVNEPSERMNPTSVTKIAFGLLTK